MLLKNNILQIENELSLQRAWFVDRGRGERKEKEREVKKKRKKKRKNDRLIKKKIMKNDSSY